MHRRSLGISLKINKEGTYLFVIRREKEIGRKKLVRTRDLRGGVPKSAKHPTKGFSWRVSDLFGGRGPPVVLIQSKSPTSVQWD